MAYCTEHLTKEDAEGALRGIGNTNILIIILSQLLVVVVMSAANPLWLALIYTAALILITVQEECREKLKDYIKKQAV